MAESKKDQTITQKLCAKFRMSDIEFVVVNAYDYNNNGHQVKCFVIPYIKKESGEQRLDEVLGADNWKNDFNMPAGQSTGLIKYKLSFRIPGTGEWNDKYEGATIDTRDKGQFSQTAFESALSFAEKRALSKLGVGRYLKLCPQIEVRVSNTWVKDWQRYSFRSKVLKDKQGKPQYVTIYWEPPVLEKKHLHEEDYFLLDDVKKESNNKQHSNTKTTPNQPTQSFKNVSEKANEKQWEIIESYFSAFDLTDQNLIEDYIYTMNVNDEDGSIHHVRKNISKDYADKIIKRMEIAYGPLENGVPVEYQSSETTVNNSEGDIKKK